MHNETSFDIGIQLIGGVNHSPLPVHVLSNVHGILVDLCYSFSTEEMHIDNTERVNLDH